VIATSASVLILISRRVERQVVTVLSPSQSGKRSFTTVTCSLRAGMGLKRRSPTQEGGEARGKRKNTLRTGLRADTEAPATGITCGPACRGAAVRSSDDGRPQRYCERTTTGTVGQEMDTLATICVNGKTLKKNKSWNLSNNREQ